ncbi:MAG: GAF domain-containing protein [Acidobacteriota bacterium]|jgi:GAF domain-containing protein
MDCRDCLAIFEDIGSAFNSPIETEQLLTLIARTVAERFRVGGCVIRLLSRDRRQLERVASAGLSQQFLQKGPVDAERSVVEALAGEVVYISDCRTDPRIQYPEAHVEEGIVSALTVPLSTRGQVIGVIRLYSRAPRDFSPLELEVLRVVASFCASAAVRAMFNQILQHVTDTIRSSLDLRAVLKGIVTVITEDLRARGAMVRLLDGSGRRFDALEAYGLSEQFLAELGAEPDEATCATLGGECLEVLDAAADPRVGYREALAAEGVASLLHVPLVLRERPLGVLTVMTHRPYDFSDDEMVLMRGIGDQCALAVHSAQMYAAVKSRYEALADDFQLWFERYRTYPSV